MNESYESLTLRTSPFTSPTDFAPISQLQLMKFKGEGWDLFGEVLSSDTGG